MKNSRRKKIIGTLNVTWKISLIAMICLNILFFVSCASRPRFDGTADFVGVVISTDSLPVEGYRVSLVTPNLKELYTFTDRKGMFSFHDIPSGSCTVRGEGEGWGKVSFKKQFFDRSALTYIQVCSIKTLFDETKRHILNGDFDEAERVISEVTPTNSKNEILLLHYMKALVFYKTGKINAAKKELAVLEKKDISNERVEELRSFVLAK